MTTEEDAPEAVTLWLCASQLELNKPLHLQVGPQCASLKVKDPESLNFRPKRLLLAICEVGPYPFL